MTSESFPRLHILGQSTLKQYGSGTHASYRLYGSPHLFELGIAEPGAWAHWGYDAKASLHYPVIARFEPALKAHYNKYQGRMKVEENGRMAIPKAYTRTGVAGLKNVEDITLTPGDQHYFVACDRMLQEEWPLCYLLSHAELTHLRAQPTDRHLLTKTDRKPTEVRTNYCWSAWRGTVDAPLESPLGNTPTACYHLVDILMPGTDAVETTWFTDEEYHAFLTGNSVAESFDLPRRMESSASV